MILKKTLFTILICAFSAQAALTQSPSLIRSRWSDSFVEWELLAPTDSTENEDGEWVVEESPVGEFKLRWLNVREDWSEWDFDVSGLAGTIRARWKDDLTQWELRSYDGSVVTMRTVWGKELTEWRVTDNDISLNLKSRWTNQFDEWQVDDDTYGSFYIYTLRSRDPRDWAIEDKLREEVSPAIRLALTFLVVFHNSPRM
jgi:hypothetical protein